MTRLSDILTHVMNMQSLRDIVGAMRSLSAMRVHEVERSLPDIRAYAQSVAAGIADAFLLAGPPATVPGSGPARKAIVLCMAEHGFVGGFDERMYRAAQAALTPGDVLFVLGTRGAAFLSERDQSLSWTHPMPTRCAAALGTVQRLADELYRRIACGEVGHVMLIHASLLRGQLGPVRQRQILPLDPASLTERGSQQPPLHNVDPITLVERLMAEYVFALLMEGVVESIGGENAARFVAMENAYGNVSDKLQMLNRDAREARQSEMTTEILDLATATMALSDAPMNDRQ